MKEILILEDKKETRELLVRMVKKTQMDVRVYEMADEKEAYSIALRKNIDLFLIDLILHPEEKGDVSGGEFAQNIRGIDKYLFTPIIIITSMYDPKLCMYSSVHCYEFIEKPFDIDRVTKTIEKAIRYNTPQKKDKLALFRVDGMLETAVVGEIICIKSVHHKLVIKTIKNKFEVPYKTCSQLLEELDCDEFVLCRRGTIVNLDYIQAVDPVNRFIHLKDRMGILEIGPVHKKGFIKKIKERSIEIIK